MKVGVYVIQGINPSAGGNFSYYEKLVASIDNFKFDSKLEICFVGRIDSGQVKLQKEYVRISSPRLHRIFHFLNKTKITKFFSRIFSTNADLCNRNDISLLRKSNVEILVFPKQFFCEVENFPFMTMNWDAGHKSTFMFPEFADGFEFRENWYRVDMQKALAVIVESESSKKEFKDFFNISENKIEIVPLFPGGVVDLVVSEDVQQATLQKFGLKKFSYFFYPAQFWAHKNHYNLILAFKQLLQDKRDEGIKLVFTGSDKGNKDYILSLIRTLNLEKDILILGFVENEEIYSFYKNSVALVMATYLGPTNMPVLEAQDLGTAVICSDLSGHRETCLNGALYVNPADPDQWCSAMKLLLQAEERNQLISLANEVRSKSLFNIHRAVKSLEELLIKFIPVRKTFY